ncbi:UNVERIFIED_CONTAM: hypothetical protein K2H54_040424 [Gekko kuhli]
MLDCPAIGLTSQSPNYFNFFKKLIIFSQGVAHLILQFLDNFSIYILHQKCFRFGFGLWQETITKYLASSLGILDFFGVIHSAIILKCRTGSCCFPPTWAGFLVASF